MLDRLSEKLGDLSRSISGKKSISEKNVQDAVEEIKLALLEADANVRVVRRFVNGTLQDALGETVIRSVTPGQQFIKVVHDRLVGLLGGDFEGLDLKGPDTVSVVLMMGLQGSGKTTTAAKLAKQLTKKGRKPYLVAADLVRPAAIEQLRLLAEQAGVPVYADTGAKRPKDVAKAALKEAQRQQYDTMIVDTAGRLQLDKELMAELSDLSKQLSPVEKLFVADSMTGQSAVDIAAQFNEEIGVTGVVLTKFDSDTRGGAALSIKSMVKVPIKYVGVGEKLEDLEPFYPDRMASRILGMGDVLSLVERAQETIDEKEAERLTKKMQSATFTLEDYLDQFRQVRKMGSLERLVEMIPGMKGQLGDQEIDETGMKKEEAIILSMTPQERRNHRIIGPPRRKRIARGSGTSVHDVNQLLKKFEKLKSMMKKMTKNKKLYSNVLAGTGGGR
ncbi:MAG: signal recognition particle protein [Spirochaetota bacterium]